MPNGTKRTTEDFIRESKIKHPDLYSYENVIYVDNLTEVDITCPIHGSFKQIPKSHLRGNGCTACSYIRAANIKKSKSKEHFFSEIKIKDNEQRWDYSEAERHFQGTNVPIPFKCNGCCHMSSRTPHNHIFKFQPCKRGCFITKKKAFELKDIDPVIIPEVSIVELPEEWKPFPLNPQYLVSNKGCIRNKNSEKISYGCLDKISGYMRTAINRKAHMLHRIVAQTFLLNPENKDTVNHKNKNRTDNRVENLEWSTYAEQNNHKNALTPKLYKCHNNGKRIMRIDKDTSKVIETYDTIMLASKWILEKVHEKTTYGKEIDDELKNISSSLSQKIKRSNNAYFVHGFIWKREDDSIKEGEVWKEVRNVEKDGYLISNYGRLQTPNKKIKEKFGKAGGYYDLKLIQGGRHHKIHRLVAFHFIDNPEQKPFVNHKNGDKFDNRVENLEWVTNQENVQHAYDNGLNSNISPVIQYDKQGKNVICEFKSIQEASNSLSIDSSSISGCCRGITVQTNGYHFKYKSDMDKEVRAKLHNPTNGKKVYQYKEQLLIQTFESKSACAIHFNVSRKELDQRIENKNTTNDILNDYDFRTEHTLTQL